MTKKPSTKQEKDHMNKVASLCCIVCSEYLDIHDSPATIHHITTSAGMGQRSKHTEVLPLCHAHHQGGGYGVALHAGEKEWQSRYGSQLELLEIVNNKLG